MEEIIQGGLEGNEYVSLLSWVMNTYPGIELMGHPELKVDMSGYPPLINADHLQSLKNEYLKVRPQLYTAIYFCIMFLTVHIQ